VGNNWKGRVEHPTDRFFEQFKEMKWGVRAAFIVLRNYIHRHRCNTPRLIIERWAPKSENATAKYLEVVCKRARLGADDVVSFDSAATMCNLFLAMCFVENGREISLDDVVAGYLLAKE
jgi:hypothetical protein